MVGTRRATKIKPIPAGDASFIIHDNSSEIANIIPEKYVEPLVIVSRILGFDGIDDYVIHLIKDKLEMYRDSCHNDDLDNEFQEYLCDMLLMGKDVVPNEWAPTRHRRYGDQSTTEKTTTIETKAEEEIDDNNDDGKTEETTTRLADTYDNEKVEDLK